MACSSKRETTVYEIQAGDICATPQPPPFLQEGLMKTKET